MADTSTIQSAEGVGRGYNSNTSKIDMFENY